MDEDPAATCLSRCTSPTFPSEETHRGNEAGEDCRKQARSLRIDMLVNCPAEPPQIKNDALYSRSLRDRYVLDLNLHTRSRIYELPAILAYAQVPATIQGLYSASGRFHMTVNCSNVSTCDCCPEEYTADFGMNVYENRVEFGMAAISGSCGTSVEFLVSESFPIWLTCHSLIRSEGSNQFH